MKLYTIAGLLLSLCLSIVCSAETGPFVGGKFQGRIAYSADGNHNDPDDWAASPVALAIFAESGHKDRLVHFDYNCILPKTDPEWEKTHAESVLGAAERYGYDLSRFHDCRKNLNAALASIAKAIDDSSADNPLYFIIAGPMEVPYLGIQKSQPEKRKFVYCISHSRWNDGFASQYTFTHTKRSVIESGVNWVQIQDQNRLLSKSPYGRPGPPESYEAYFWMRDSDDAKVRFLWERLQVSTRPDPSDAGMAYFLVSGDEECDPAKLRRLLNENRVPTPIAVRQRVRLEAENFRALGGFEIEDRNDRTSSHRLAAKLVKGEKGRVGTRLSEPFTAVSGRYDLEVRYFDDPKTKYSFSLRLNGAPAGSSWESAGKESAWTSHVIRDVELRTGDDVAVEVQGNSARLDYIQLNAR